MPLFADADPTTFVTLALTALAGLFAWLNSRTKAQFDATMVRLETTVGHLERAVSECHAERDELRQDIRALREQNRGQGAAIAETREKVAVVEKAVAVLPAVIKPVEGGRRAYDPPPTPPGEADR